MDVVIATMFPTWKAVGKDDKYSLMDTIMDAKRFVQWLLL